ncbi:MAG TPA: hypothetical protein DCP31_27410, partial [Cyanobacteria bacterium UBA8543]|nr:hypothetical protein [Cyanobacteria bacterium UBA8543]
MFHGKKSAKPKLNNAFSLFHQKSFGKSDYDAGQEKIKTNRQYSQPIQFVKFFQLLLAEPTF